MPLYCKAEKGLRPIACGMMFETAAKLEVTHASSKDLCRLDVSMRGPVDSSLSGTTWESACYWGCPPFETDRNRYHTKSAGECRRQRGE